MLSSPHKYQLDHRNLDFNEACSAFTRVATRQLAHQPEADFVGRLQHLDYSPCCYPSLGGSWLLPPRDFPQQPRVTLWITTAIHLDTHLGKSDTIICRMPGVVCMEESGDDWW